MRSKHASHVTRIIAGLALCFAGCATASTAPEEKKPRLPYTFTCSLAETGYAQIEVTVEVPDADWAEEGNESVVAELRVDGVFSSHLVLPGGIDRWPAAALSRTVLTAGEHTITLEVDAGRSRTSSAVIVHDAGCRTVDAGRPPLLVGRRRLSNTITDLPLGMYRTPAGGGWEYVVIFSNEDGGTGAIPAMLLAQWGRLIDTEWIYTYDGTATDPGRYQAKNHTVEPFNGYEEEGRPWLETATGNNNFAAWPKERGVDVTGYLLFSLPLIDDPGAVEAAILEQHPAWQELSNLELRREHGWEDPPDPESWDLPDLREILWIDYEGDPLPSVSLRVTTDQGEFSADRGQPDFRASGSGFRTAVEVPRGAVVERLQAVSEASLAGIDGTFSLFRLDASYRREEISTVSVADAIR